MIYDIPGAQVSQMQEVGYLMDYNKRYFLAINELVSFLVGEKRYMFYSGQWFTG